MSGFYGIIAPDNKPINDVTSFFYSHKLDHIINESSQAGNFQYGRSVIDRFESDRSTFANDKYVVLFEGICFNKSVRSIPESIIDWYEQDPDDFVKQIDGIFAGFLFDIEKKVIIIFNDHLASRPVYIYHSPDNRTMVFASELKVVARILDQLGISKNVDIEAVKYFLCMGFYPYDHTPVCEVKRMNYATLTSFSLSTFQLKTNRYFSYFNDNHVIENKTGIIENINELMVSSIRKEWNKDVENSYDHYAFLSGGLDSRVNVLLANKLGFKPINTITFSESDADDAVIAKQIADKNKLNHSFTQLDGGDYLVDNPKNYIYANDGMVNYSGSAHGMSVIQRIIGKNYGLLHTGQIGDLLFGSHSAPGSDVKSMIMKNMNPDTVYLADQSQILHKVINDYRDKGYEIFAYEQKAINGTLNGDRSLNHYVDIMSPFYDRKMIEYCLSIPDKFKKHEAIYIDWMNQYHPYLSEYRWEKAGVRPISVSNVVMGHTFKRALNHLRGMVGVAPVSMNPFEKWVKINSRIYGELDHIFEEYKEIGMDLIDNIDLEKLYKESSDVQLKFKTITLLVSLNLHFT